MQRFTDQIRGAASAWAINAFADINRYAVALKSRVLPKVQAALEYVAGSRVPRRSFFGRTRRRWRRAVNALRRRLRSRKVRHQRRKAILFKPQQRMMYRQLEPRMVFDAAAVATADAVTDTQLSPAEADAAASAESESAANSEDLVQAPCKGTPELEPDPHQCVRAMLQGYVEYANEQAFPPREPSR